MIRVVHLVSSLSTGGTEMMLYKLLRDMDRKTFPSVVISLTQPGAVAERIRALGVPVETLAMARGIPSPLAAVRLYRLLRAFRPHVLQTWLYHADLLGFIIGRRAGVPAIAWNIRCSTTDRRYVRGLSGLTVRLLARLSAGPDVVVVNSNAGIAVHRALGYGPRRWAMIPNGFELDVFRPDAAAGADLRRELGIPPETKLVGLIARYDPLKDHDTFLRAAADLAISHPSAHFVLAGAGVDRANPALVTLVNELGLGGRIHMLGERDDIPRITAALDVATCSSTGEGFPNIVGEAMSCATPIVSTDVGDARAVVGDGGVVVPPRQPQALAQGWRSVLDLGEQERRNLGARARARIVEHYALNKIAARYAELYGELSALAITASGSPVGASH